MIQQREIYLRRGHKAFGDTKKRPCIVVSLNSQNQASSSVIVVPCSTDLAYFIPHVRVKLAKGEGGLKSESIALCDRLAAIPQMYLIPEALGIISNSSFEKIQYGIAASVGLIL